VTDADEDVDADDGRPETRNQRSDRNWVEILQELRVTQTGTQIMSGFLLTLPFQQRFASIHSYELAIYVVLIILAGSTTAVGLAPVALHRGLFHRHEKAELVRVADRLLRVTIWLVAALTTGVVLFVLDFTIGIVAGIIGGIVAALVLVSLLGVVPLVARRRRHLPA
jgi:predicted cation transporter